MCLAAWKPPQRRSGQGGVHFRSWFDAVDGADASCSVESGGVTNGLPALNKKRPLRRLPGRAVFFAPRSFERPVWSKDLCGVTSCRDYPLQKATRSCVARSAPVARPTSRWGASVRPETPSAILSVFWCWISCTARRFSDSLPQSRRTRGRRRIVPRDGRGENRCCFFLSEDPPPPAMGPMGRLDQLLPYCDQALSFDASAVERYGNFYWKSERRRFEA